ncbi:hypothetical protein [Brevibacillus laterosporus]|uniref:hypothetical protein n=1 Tax=Brevibacillus laterosporus TaxID=1465 RepID=UPI0015E22BA7|nr:hypothetical protein [Brevibacillus laterosporus]MED1666320.1 hypothetical protein [Brevibacillus laterosporus]MED1670643.1 hypothetical protein [Brevibacillus laterosporus]MED1716650.1 hypothetical protein [Brevibacillus laterosporus]
MESMKRVTPGTKIYKLFEHDKFVCEGTEEVFLIFIEKLTKEEFKKRLEENLKLLEE